MLKTVRDDDIVYLFKGGSMSKKVIIADDSKFLTKNIKEFFEKEMDFDVVAVAFNGVEAVDLYRIHKPDLITLDITMPEKDGEDALDDIIREFPEAKVVMMSAVRGETMGNCIKAGASAFIEKPLKFTDPDFVENFKETIEEVLEG